MDGDATRRDAAAAISGDAEALDRLWRAHRRWAAAVVLAHMPRDADLEDLVQDIALTIVRTISDLRDPAMFRPWLRRIAVNAARTAGRRKSTRLRLVRPDRSGTPIDGIPAAVGADNSAEGRRLLELAHRLHPDYREPLLLRCVRGMSHRQIAEALGLPVTTVETRITRARKMLREEVEFENDAATLRVTRAGGAE